MRRADYNSGRDAVSGDIITIVAQDLTPEHFTDERPDAHLACQAEAVASAEERFERHRDAKLNAAIGALMTLIDDAKSGSGRAASACVQAASADLIIPMLGNLLSSTREKLAADDPDRLRIDTALSAAGL